MSQIQRQSRVASDFSIARILSEDDTKKSRESFFAEAIGSYKSDEGLSLSGESHQVDDSFTQRQSNGTESLGCSGLAANYVDYRRANISSFVKFCDHSSSLSFETTGVDCLNERITGLKRSPDSSTFVRAPSEVKSVKIDRSELSWLQCTRYRPPKLPRKSVTGKSGKRRPGTHPRIPFTSTQLQVLEDKYRRTAYLSRRDVIQLSTMLRLPQSRVKIWFQNRRARDRRESAISGSNVTILSNDAPATDKSKNIPVADPMAPSPV